MFSIPRADARKNIEKVMCDFMSKKKTQQKKGPGFFEKNWRILVALFCFVSGVSAFPENLLGGVVMILIAAILILWPFIWKKVTETQRRKKLEVQTEEQNDIDKKPPKKQTSIPKMKNDTAINADVPDIASLVPRYKDEAPEAYRYVIDISIANKSAVLDAMREKKWYLDPHDISDEIHLFSGPNDIGILPQKQDMLRDWIQRGDPYLIVIKGLTGENTCSILLVFYRDKEKMYAYREQTVVALTACWSEDKQDSISCIGKGEELEFEENWDKPGVVSLLYCCNPIGNLPKKEAERYSERGAVLAVFDHTEEQDDSRLKPFIKIYW